MIIGDRHIFTGTSTADKMMEKYNITRTNALKIMEAEWGRPVIEIGVPEITGNKGVQLDFHIDLTMTVVYSPVKKKEVILLGSVQKFFDHVSLISPKDFRSKTERQVLKTLKKSMKDLGLREKRLEAIEKKLQAQGYEVIRIPYFNDEKIPLINYNNVVLSEGQVIFPLNGFRKLDIEMKALFNSLGYETLPVRVVQRSFQFQGGIRCLSETFRKNRVTIPH